MSTAVQVSENRISICFKEKSFCFTGELAGLKRTAAEREVRARGGLSMKDVNTNLDYLIVGEKGSAFWKYGSYGTKIEKARHFSHVQKGQPQLVPEFDFMLALGECAPETQGDVHSKVFIANYQFLVKPDGAINADHLQSWLCGFRESRAVHVQFRTYDFGIYQDLFETQEKERATGTLVHVRFVKQMDLDQSGRRLAEE